MCRHRVLFCFLFEDSLVTQFPIVSRSWVEKSTSDVFLKTAREDTESVKVYPQRFPVRIRRWGDTKCVDTVSPSVSILKTAAWHNSRGNCVTKLAGEIYFGCFLKTERGYRKFKSVSTTVSLFHQTMRGYEMCRHRILFCFLFEDSIVTQLSRELCHEAGWGHLLRMFFWRQRGDTESIKVYPHWFPFFIKRWGDTKCVDIVSSSVSF